ncbi:DUF397 domain-containing protein [Actinokineospora sp. HUAS TT18]|uniref:DUF397 domain-containing protein n=1 Tax=Actinokineospora sp. HUAS TT18 TaxID=3447451 RepID=UPI003F5241F3
MWRLVRDNPVNSSPRWRTSTTGRRAPGMTTGRWRKSSFSSGTQNDCVEIALTPDHAGIRDSKNAHGPTLTVTPATWSTFITVLTST